MSEIGDKGVVENWRRVLSTIGAGCEVPGEGIRLVMDQIMSGISGGVQTAMLAFGLLAERITAVELDATAEGVLSFARSAHDSQPAGAIERGVIDIVGTGDDGANTVNISTMSVTVIAASGVPALKHDNRAASSESDGVGTLEAFGINIEDGLVTPPGHPDFCVRFLFIARFHPAMRSAGSVRKELVVPTVFNLLGPLTGPVRPQISLIGYAFGNQTETMVNTFVRRGQRALIVHGSDGPDEVTVAGPTKVFVMENGEAAESVIDPHDYDMEYSETDALRGGDPTYNADVACRIWAGELEGPIRDAAILNSVAAIVILRGLGDRSLKGAMANSIGEVKETLQLGLCLDILTTAMKS